EPRDDGDRRRRRRGRRGGRRNRREREDSAPFADSQPIDPQLTGAGADFDRPWMASEPAAPPPRAPPAAEGAPRAEVSPPAPPGPGGGRPAAAAGPAAGPAAAADTDAGTRGAAPALDRARARPLRYRLGRSPGGAAAPTFPAGRTDCRGGGARGHRAAATHRLVGAPPHGRPEPSRLLRPPPLPRGALR